MIDPRRRDPGRPRPREETVPSEAMATADARAGVHGTAGAEGPAGPDATAGPDPRPTPISREDRERGIGPLGRREFLALGVGAFVLLSLPAAFRSRRVLVRRRVPLMGTLAELAVPDSDGRRAHAAIDAAIEELRRVEALMTRFRPDSDVGRANLAAAGAPVPVADDTAEVLRAALRWAESTEGRFDPCLARAVALWDVSSRREPPPREEVAPFAGRRLHRSLELERRGSGFAARLHDPAAGLDLGGIAKGYGVDRAVAALRERGIRDALVNVGGDLYALGRSEDGDPWEIGIRSPSDPRRLAATLQVVDRALATSGDYARFFEHRGRRYHHLLDPATAAPRRSGVHSVTVEAESCAAADAAATAVFGAPTADADRMMRRAALEGAPRLPVRDIA